MSQASFAARVGTLVTRVELELARRLDALPRHASRLADAMRQATLGGGKRLRPLLVYASGQALGLPLEQLDAPAAAVELIHCYSLVHDDLPAMDDDALRRGQPTIHVAWDEATAILAGDALQALAFETLADVEDAEAARGMSRLLAHACGVAGMAGGQALDLEFEGGQPSQDEVEAMYRQKTGALIAAAVLLPAEFRPQPEPARRQALADFAWSIGLAFQIRDDLLEVEGDSARIGKSASSDAERSKASWPARFGTTAARERMQTLEQQAHRGLEALGGPSEGLYWLGEKLLNRSY